MGMLGVRSATGSARPGPVGFGEEIARFVQQRAHLSSFDRLLVAQMGHHFGSRLLEVGCGGGTMTRLLLDRELVVAIDTEPESVREVQARLGHHGNLVCLPADITSPGRQLQAFALDSVVCANVLEHIADDEVALRQIAAVLPYGGTLVLVVPACPRLYGSLDRAVGHYRRYSLQELRMKIRRAGFVETEIRWFNALGTLGWYWNGKVRRRAALPDWQLRLFDRIARPAMAIESRLPLGIGLSLVAACVKA